MKKYKIYFRIKDQNDYSTSRMEANINAETFGTACDILREEIKETGISSEQIIILQGYEEVYNSPETIVLPEDM